MLEASTTRGRGLSERCTACDSLCESPEASAWQTPLISLKIQMILLKYTACREASMSKPCPHSNPACAVSAPQLARGGIHKALGEMRACLNSDGFSGTVQETTGSTQVADPVDHRWYARC